MLDVQVTSSSTSKYFIRVSTSRRMASISSLAEAEAMTAAKGNVPVRTERDVEIVWMSASVALGVEQRSVDSVENNEAQFERFDAVVRVEQVSRQ